MYAIVLGSLSVCQAAYGQFVPYSQYHNAPLLTNPAAPALTDYTQVTFHYRGSRIASYDIPSVSFIMPFYRQSNGLRYGGIGVNIIQQEAGPNSMYRVTGGTATFGYTLHLSSTNHIGAGIGAGFVRKSIDPSGITTDSQYSLGVYDPSLSNGENIQSNSATRPVINAGLGWVLTGADDREKASLGVAAYNMNKPLFDLLDNAPGDNMTYIVNGEVALLTRNQLTISPTFRYIYQPASTANVGARLSYSPIMSHSVISAGLWYKTTHALVAGAQYNYKSIFVSASMDFSIGADLDANINNAVEVAFGWRMNRKERVKARRESAIPEEKPVDTAPIRKREPTQPSTSESSKPAEKQVQPAPQTQQAQPASQAPVDSTKSNTAAPKNNTKTEEPESRPQTASSIQFELGSNKVSPEGETQLEELAEILKSHPDHTLKITGHGCTQGERRVTERVSLQRAQSVADILIAKGVPKEQLEVIGMGSRKPIASNATKAGRQKNRRVEFEWIKK
jgi:type IX secretion system PorP/SprF family membrane protein